MRVFRCNRCGNALYFENWRCLRCGSLLAFLPDRMDLCAIEPAPGQDPQDPSAWWRLNPAAASTAPAGGLWRLCVHHTQTQSCNFGIPAHDPNPLCVSCRQTRVLPDLSQPGNLGRWYRIEVAKRRLFFTLAQLGLVEGDPAAGRDQGPHYRFLADTPDQPVLTGHAEGVITLNIAEADDDERERRRLTLHEPYRTLLGHLRHESGHYYWDALLRDAPALAGFRALFGDERADYGQALQAHYARGGAIPDWQATHVSAYATAHPWEDWAETWAHYLHMVDLVETAASFETQLNLPGTGSVPGATDGSALGAPAAQAHPRPQGAGTANDFDTLAARWVPLTLLVNSLNRSLGQDDAYPFALSPGALGKLRFVHALVADRRGSPGQALSVPAP